MKVKEGMKVDKEFIPGGEMPFSDASLFVFETVKRPECILRLDREGGIMIACDSLQNWVEPDQFFDKGTIAIMQQMKFFRPANLGPAWMFESQPAAEDFVRLKEIPFEHVLCGHGYPMVNNARRDFLLTFNEYFNI